LKEGYACITPHPNIEYLNEYSHLKERRECRDKPTAQGSAAFIRVLEGCEGGKNLRAGRLVDALPATIATGARNT
jgi:hypothetical protein